MDIKLVILVIALHTIPAFASNTTNLLNAERAWEICTHKVLEVAPGIFINEASELMVGNKIHHLVVTENNVIKGIVSSIALIREGMLNKNA